MKLRLIILRGLPGAGKSTYVQANWPGATPLKYAPPGWDTVVCSADHFFTSLDGTYNFDIVKLGQAHAECTVNVIKALRSKCPVVIYDNTCSQKWEWAVVKEIAEALGYESEIHSVFDGGKSDEELAARNLHGVPVEKIAAMRARWEV